MNRLNAFPAGLLAATAALAVGACTSEPIGGPLVMELAAEGPVQLLSAVNENGQKCWIRSGDRQFRGLALIPELDTSAGKPRLLIVEKGKAAGLPKLVIEASGDPVKVQTYGPLASSPVSKRINEDVIDWSQNQDDC